MHTLTGKLDVRLEDEATLRRLMAFYHYSTRSLAAAATDELARIHRASGAEGAPLTLSKSTVGNLTNGTYRTCRFEYGIAIERVLRQTPGLLFTPKVSRIEVDARQLTAA
ncbi:hypothetical protein QNA23_10515 [Rhodococcus erythropolis]|uniref:hypothetical protein n=1 Tax=Rhodococcus erythropolis TaxID=1833 RepID=UPI0024B908F9|nr:hypothetical protein [Rhodococcus erythropolis]MDJ0403914.1 hypothetical protein [Rhodococcus erythropolis]